jgi:hypothetical protein
VEKDPTAVEDGEGSGLLTGMKGGDEAEEEADGEDEDAEGDGFVAPVDEEKRYGEEETEEGLGLVSVDRKGVVGGIEHLGERDEVEEDGGDGGGDGDVTPTGTVVKCCRQDRERGYAVEEDRDSEPEEGHKRSVMDDALCGDNRKHQVYRFIPIQLVDAIVSVYRMLLVCP